MANKMVGKKRVWVDEDAPQKSTQPVKAAGLLAPVAAPAAPAAPDRMGIDELLKRNVASGQVLAPLTQKLGIPEWEYSAGGMDESGNPLSLGIADPALAQKLAGYSFDWKDTGPANTGTLTAFDPGGKEVGAYDQRDQSGGDAFKEFVGMGAGLLAGPLGLGASLGGALGLSGTLGSVVGGGLIGGGTAALTDQNIGKGLLMGGLGGAVSSYFGAPTGATAGADAIGNGAFLGEGVASGVPAWDNAGSLLDGIPGITSNPAAALDAYTAANPVTLADVMQSMPQISAPSMPSGLPDIPAIKFDAPASIQAAVSANPVTMPEVLQTMPQISAPPVQATFNAAKDSQAYNADNNITQPVNTTPPKTVNLGTFDNPAYAGGTMATAGGLQGVLDVAKQTASDTLTTPNAVTGGGAAGGALDWLKQNPAWGRLLLGGATSLLSGAGGGSGSSGSTAPSGPPVTWNSGLQQGLLSPVQQYAPAAITQNRPAGLLAQGFQNDGAWRYLKG